LCKTANGFIERTRLKTFVATIDIFQYLMVNGFIIKPVANGAPITFERVLPLNPLLVKMKEKENALS